MTFIFVLLRLAMSQRRNAVAKFQEGGFVDAPVAVSSRPV